MKKQKKDNLQSLISRGDNCYKTGDYDKALEYYDKAISLNKQSLEAWNGKGLCLTARGEYNLGIICFKEALNINNNVGIVWNNIGVNYFHQGSFEIAKDYFLKSIEIEPSLLAYYNLCDLYFRKNEFISALFYLEKAISLEPENSELWSAKGSVQFELNKLDEAVSSFEKAIVFDNNNYNAYSSLGYIYLIKEDHRLAEEYLTKSYEINDTNHIILSNLSLLNSDKGEYLQALEYAKKAVELAPYIPALWEDCAMCLYDLIVKKGITTKGSFKDIGVMLAKGEKSVVSFFNELSEEELSQDDIKSIVYTMFDSDDFFTETIGANVDINAYKRIYYQSLKIISLLHVSEDEEFEFGHYTQKNVVEALIFDESPLRLNSITTANDPNEGESLLSILGFSNINIGAKYQAFVGCFTFNFDSLNQFRLYGKSDHIEATGVSVVVNDDFFESEVNINNSLIVKSNINHPSKKITKESLFRCIYVDPQTSRVISVGHKEACVFYRESYKYKDDIDNVVERYTKKIKDKEQAVIKGIYELSQQVNDLYNLILDETDKGVMNNRMFSFQNKLPILLTHLKYLVKHYAFREEQECRIIKVEKLERNSYIMVDEDKSRMYINYFPLCKRTENTNHITSLYFGTKAKDFEMFRDRVKHSGLSSLLYKSTHPFS